MAIHFLLSPANGEHLSINCVLSTSYAQHLLSVRVKNFVTDSDFLFRFELGYHIQSKNSKNVKHFFLTVNHSLSAPKAQLS